MRDRATLMTATLAAPAVYICCCWRLLLDRSLLLLFIYLFVVVGFQTNRISFHCQDDVFAVPDPRIKCMQTHTHFPLPLRTTTREALTFICLYADLLARKEKLPNKSYSWRVCVCVCVLNDHCNIFMAIIAKVLVASKRLCHNCVANENLEYNNSRQHS